MRFTCFSFIIIIKAFLVTSLVAQTKVGVLAGLNATNVKTEEMPDGWENKAIFRYYGGVYAEALLVKRLSIEAILLYSHKGWKFKSIAPENVGSMNLHYLSFQVLPKFLITNRIGLKLGGEVGYLLKTRRKPAVSFFESYYKNLDYGIVVGAEYKLSDRIGLTISYIHGLAYISPHDIVGDDGQNRVLQIGASIDLLGTK